MARPQVSFRAIDGRSVHVEVPELGCGTISRTDWLEFRNLELILTAPCHHARFQGPTVPDFIHPANGGTP